MIRIFKNNKELDLDSILDKFITDFISDHSILNSRIDYYVDGDISQKAIVNLRSVTGNILRGTTDSEAGYILKFIIEEAILYASNTIRNEIYEYIEDMIIHTCGKENKFKDIINLGIGSSLCSSLNSKIKELGFPYDYVDEFVSRIIFNIDLTSKWLCFFKYIDGDEDLYPYPYHREDLTEVVKSMNLDSADIIHNPNLGCFVIMNEVESEDLMLKLSLDSDYKIINQSILKNIKKIF